MPFWRSTHSNLLQLADRFVRINSLAAPATVGITSAAYYRHGRSVQLLLRPPAVWAVVFCRIAGSFLCSTTCQFFCARTVFRFYPACDAAQLQTSGELGVPIFRSAAAQRRCCPKPRSPLGRPSSCTVRIFRQPVVIARRLTSKRSVHPVLSPVRLSVRNRKNEASQPGCPGCASAFTSPPAGCHAVPS